MSNIKEELLKPFPKEAYGEDKSRGFPLTTIDAYYVIERLNNVFGLCGTGWGLDVKEYITTEKEIVALSHLWYKNGTEIKRIECEGGKKIVHDNLTDAYKSARTNAICKGASFLGVGLDVYKGEYKNGDGDKPAPNNQPNPAPKKKLEHPYIKPKTETPVKKGSNKYVFTEKRKKALEKIFTSHLLTGAEKDDVQDLLATCDAYPTMNEDTLERLQTWFSDWFGTKEKNYEDGQSFIRHQAEEQNKEDVPF